MKDFWVNLPSEDKIFYGVINPAWIILVTVFVCLVTGKSIFTTFTTVNIHSLSILAMILCYVVIMLVDYREWRKSRV